MTPDEFKRLFPQASADTIFKNCGVSPGPDSKQGADHVGVAKASGKNPDPVRRLVRITTCRRRLLDDDNPFPKYFVDALRYAGILFDDSPAWAQIEVVQKLVRGWDAERTEIEVFDLSEPTRPA